VKYHWNESPMTTWLDANLSQHRRDKDDKKPHGGECLKGLQWVDNCQRQFSIAHGRFWSVSGRSQVANFNDAFSSTRPQAVLQ